MEFIAGNLALILCGLAGLGLLLTEAFMPGFGIAGIAGIILEVIAVYSAWVHHGGAFALIMTAILLVIIGGTVYLSYRSAMRGRLSRSDLMLKDTEIPVPDRAKDALAEYVNRQGRTVSMLRPGGTVEIGGVRVNAASSGELIEKGTEVRVTGVEGDHVVVCPVKG